MKQLIIKWGAFLTLSFVSFMLLFLNYPDRYCDSYQRALVRQYDYLQECKDDEKIVVIGASTLSFGLDMDTMEKISGEKVVILGNHIGEGTPFEIEMSKSALKQGDKVIIELYDQTMDEGAPMLLLTGLGHRIDMYRFFVPELFGKVALTIPTVVRKNYVEEIDDIRRIGGVYTIYSIDAYDERGNMTLKRGECTLSDPYTGESGWADYELIPLNQEYVDYLNEYSDYCEERGINVYFTIMPSFDEMVRCTDEAMDARDELWALQLDAPLISHSVDYKFPRKYVFDGHCNSAGQVYRTELLYKDLMNTSN